MKVPTYCIALFCFCSSCLAKPKHKPVSGIFTTYRLGIMKRFWMEWKLNGYVYPLPVAMVYLRSDNTYVMGFCDNQIAEAGRYSCHEDSVLLYDRYNFRQQAKLPSRTMYYDSKNSLLYFMRPARKKPFDNIIPLKKDWKHAHYGFLRGQEMSLDSIMKYYQQRSVEEQNSWTDSVWNAMYLK